MSLLVGRVVNFEGVFLGKKDRAPDALGELIFKKITMRKISKSQIKKIPLPILKILISFYGEKTTMFGIILTEIKKKDKNYKNPREILRHFG